MDQKRSKQIQRARLSRFVAPVRSSSLLSQAVFDVAQAICKGKDVLSTPDHGQFVLFRSSHAIVSKKNTH